MRQIARNTECYPLMMNFDIPRVYEEEKDVCQVVYDNERQVVYYLGGSSGGNNRTESKRNTTMKAGSGADDPKYVTDDWK